MLDAGCWILDDRCWILDTGLVKSTALLFFEKFNGLKILVAGFWMLVAEYWIMDAGFWVQRLMENDE